MRDGASHLRAALHGLPSIARARRGLRPPLDGVGHTGVEAILRNLLTPSAAIEGGYRSFSVLTRDGLVVEGLLASRDEQTIVIRRRDLPDAVIPVADAVHAEYASRSIMPEGLLQSMKPQEVSDLFTFLKVPQEGNSLQSR